MTSPRRVLASVTVLTALICAYAPNPVSAEEKIPLKLAIPVEPIAAIVDAFRSHRIVALGDNHGNEQGHKFRLSLIRDPRFAAAVDDIVVEFGSARYQDLMDRFVHGGDVSYESSRQVWQNTTQPEYEWDLPIYEEFFRAVRSVSGSLPREQQVRVLVGGPPVDWDRVHTIEDLRKQMGDRDDHAVEVIRSEVLARNRRCQSVRRKRASATTPGGQRHGRLPKVNGRKRHFLPGTQADSAWPEIYARLPSVKIAILGTIENADYNVDVLLQLDGRIVSLPVSTLKYIYRSKKLTTRRLFPLRRMFVVASE